MTGRPTPPPDSAPKRTPKRTGTRIIAVGDLYPPDLWADGAEASDIVYLTFEEVSAETLQRLKPDVILSPLVSPGFDCWDLAERLVAAGYRGKLRAVAQTVPDPALVRREIANRFPELDFDLVALDAPS